MSEEATIRDERGRPRLWREPRRWRSYQYGKYRFRDQNFRAWFFADSYGRRTIGELRQIKHEIKRQRRSRP